MMDKVFAEMRGREVEVYINDMIVKTKDDQDSAKDLEFVFQRLWQFNLRLNPLKCTFGMEAGKFLGFMLTSREIEANPDKCRAILDMSSPRTVKDVQQLTGRVAALSRFLPISAKRCLPMFKILKKQDSFEWTQECEVAFQELKTSLAYPPILTKPMAGDTLILYLAVADEAVSGVLIREEGKDQFPIYFVSKVLQGAELNYQRLEKVAFALLVASRKLRPYFQCYPVLVRTNQPIRQILHKPDLAGRMMSWAIELTQYDISYKPRLAIKAQVLANFLAEMTHLGENHPGE